MQINPADLYIDNHGPFEYEFVMEQSTLTEGCAYNYEPDPQWFHIDSKGHFHAFDFNSTDPLPTLEREEISVEYHGEDVSHYGIYLCKLCRESIEPNYLDIGLRYDVSQGHTQLGFTIPRYNRSISKEQRVSFYTTHMFGIARVVAFGIEESWDGKNVSVTFEAEFAAKRNHDL